MQPTSRATYYNSCVCSEKGTETFAYCDPALHSYTNAATKEDALKAVGICKDGTVYYYFCSICRAVGHNSDHILAGKKDAANHMGGKETRNKVDPNHKTQISGYSGDTYCLGCNAKPSSDTTVPPSPHMEGNNWYHSETEHWSICSVDGCGMVPESTRECL